MQLTISLSFIAQTFISVSMLIFRVLISTVLCRSVTIFFDLYHLFPCIIEQFSFMLQTRFIKF